MFKDRDAQLRRLEDALLEEEELPQVLPSDQAPEDADLLADEVLDELLEDTAPMQSPVAYQNYSNDYGNAYNADSVDVDLEDYCEQVRSSGKKDHSTLVIILCLLALGVLGAAIFLMLRQGGFL